MRIAHIHDPLIGVIADVYMPAAQDKIWQRARLSAFRNVCESAEEHRADCILISGRLFGEVYVTDAVISQVLEIIQGTNCRVVWAADEAGLKYLGHKDSLPKNFTLLTRGQENCMAGDVCIQRWSAGGKAPSGGGILLLEKEPLSEDLLKMLAQTLPELWYMVSDEGFYTREKMTFTANKAVKMENVGFEDTGASGYHLLTFDHGKLTGKEFIETKIYTFKTVAIGVEAEDDQKSVLHKCMQGTMRLTDRTFVRIILTGRVDVETFIHTDAIRDVLKNRFFYLEVFNGCELELDEEAYAGDISLKSEFIRMVMADDTLSGNEKSRIIQCGWNALRGKELSE